MAPPKSGKTLPQNLPLSYLQTHVFSVWFSITIPAMFQHAKAKWFPEVVSQIIFLHLPFSLTLKSYNMFVLS
ncbi:uncharacterized protein MELLADRAFT_86620 [Melampsora larici-populina 98AG31]|uniref:Uncharacterized protein n=1 Tax=Melampsora larici-populina (strain 98AG31 / pathotype 3-4-7) TaxID=747676 RepID=F4RMG1_MELLP|nr:uncharacterized protein MELLADRAFT_86620 [Melampsora larici-populina 98AG31]EGG06480.1 hypothetical protein MELLADRAFT_86620 [Melampsora larici-populina 98AG31]